MKGLKDVIGTCPKLQFLGALGTTATQELQTIMVATMDMEETTTRQSISHM